MVQCNAATPLAPFLLGLFPFGNMWRARSLDIGSKHCFIYRPLTYVVHSSLINRNVTWTTWPITRTIHRVGQSGRSIYITWPGEFTCEKWHVTAAGTDRHAVLSFTLLSSGRFPPVFRSCGGVCGKFPRVTNSEFGAELTSAVDLTEPMDRLN